MKALRYATMLSMACGTVLAGSITYTSTFYVATVNHGGDITKIEYPIGGPDHVSRIVGAFTRTNPGMLLDDPGFHIVSDVSLADSVSTSIISNQQVRIAIRTQFMRNQVIAQSFTIRNISGSTINFGTFAHIQDADVQGTGLNDSIYADWINRVFIQGEGDTYIASSLYNNALDWPSDYQGGYYRDVFGSATNGGLTGYIYQTNDTALAVSLPVNSLFAGAERSFYTRTAFSINYYVVSQNALPLTFVPTLQSLGFAVNFKKIDSDTVGFKATFDATGADATVITSLVACVNVGYHVMLNKVPGTGKANDHSITMTYAMPAGKVVLKINRKKNTGVIKGKELHTKVSSDFSIADNGITGALDLPVRFWFSGSTNGMGACRATVIYSNKLHNQAKGKL